MKDRDIHTAIRILRREVPKWETPIVTLMAETYESPFRVLISCTKAKNILEICRTLIDQYGGSVPDEIDELLKFKGVGRKTANLVVTLGYKKPGICVDTHVHRISNRWGYINTKTPEKTEIALRAKLPKQYWIEYNDLLVSFGQHLCRPISPLCSQCPVKKYCRQIGVTMRR